MNYADIKCPDIANGPGCRVSVFVSGCRRHCKGCFNSEAWDFNYGKEFTTETMFELLELLDSPNISGLSILGGDPFEPENWEAIYEICGLVRMLYPDKNIWLWTGYLWEDIKHIPVVKYIDVLIDGPFIEVQRDLTLYFRGSRNQRVIDVKKSLETGHVVKLEGEWK